MAVGRGTILTVLLSEINSSQDLTDNERPGELRRAHGRVGGIALVIGTRKSDSRAAASALSWCVQVVVDRRGNHFPDA